MCSVNVVWKHMIAMTNSSTLIEDMLISEMVSLLDEKMCVVYATGFTATQDEKPVLQMDDLLHQANNSLSIPDMELQSNSRKTLPPHLRR